MRLITFILCLSVAACANHQRVPAVIAQTKPIRARARPVPVEPNVPGVRLAWNANPEPDIAGYKMWYSFIQGGPKRERGSLIQGTSTMVPQLMMPIYWTVKAYNHAGMISPASNEVMVPAY